MIKLFFYNKNTFILFIVLALFGCLKNDYQYKTKHSSKHKTRPSELMSIGTPKNNRFKRNEEINSKIFQEIDQEILDEDSSEPYQSLDDEDSKILNKSEYKGYFKIGNPYKIFGISYFPKDYKNFKEKGVASWYGDEFHGQPTANGETYDMQEMTAAHKTLPLPSIVRVTNLKNGKSVKVRVNDRGPFTKDRIIDVSEKAATVLDFKNVGTTDVSIELLREETDEFLKKFNITKPNN